MEMPAIGGARGGARGAAAGGVPSSQSGSSMLRAAGLPVEQQAVHLYFLQEMQYLEVTLPDVAPEGEAPGDEAPPMRTVKLGQLKLYEVVKYFIAPLTAAGTKAADCSLVSALASGGASLPEGCDWLSGDGRFTDDRIATGQSGRPVFGAATFFVTHAWSYRFKDLVSLISQHYAMLPAESGWLDVYYWVDAFALPQGIELSPADLTKSLTTVIQSSRSVLFTIHPLLRPSTPKRLWCLYEALLAHTLPGAHLEMLVDDSGSADAQKGKEPARSFAGAYVELLGRFEEKVIKPLDMCAASASLGADKQAILTAVGQMGTNDSANTTLRLLLASLMSDALLRHALKNGDAEAVSVLIERGTQLHGASVHLAAIKRGGNETVEVLAEALARNALVTSVHVVRSGVRAGGALALGAALAKHPALNELDLTDNDIGPDGILALVSGLSRCAPLRRLVLWGTNCGDEGAAALGKALSGGAPWKDLDIGYNPSIGPSGFSSLASGVAASRALSSLSLARCGACVRTGLEGDGGGALGRAVAAAAALTTLDLSGCGLTAEHLGALAAGLLGGRGVGAAPVALSSLTLDENELTGADAGSHLAALLKGCPRLETLHVNGNAELGGKSAMAALAGALGAAPELRMLGLSGTGLTPDGAKALSSALPSARRLTHLDVGENYELGDAGVAPILAALKGHKSLARLNLSSTGISAASQAGLLTLLASAVPSLPALGGARGGVKARGSSSSSGVGAGGLPGAALMELVVVGNPDLPDKVDEEIAAWKTRLWVASAGLR
ncbi:hypothetical protein FOA52_010639 [Chlamydomonas sp. UWO 241]|nr:hypothetical protein FOA52_010639 [Chlamydomonas sp. UWO 241]